MQIKIEIDVRPDELRRFLGLPDVSGLQDDVINFLRDKIEAAGDFDAGHFVKNNLDSLRSNSAWQKLVGKVRLLETIDEVAAAAVSTGPDTPSRPKKTRATSRKSGASPRKRAGSRRSKRSSPSAGA